MHVKHNQFKKNCYILLSTVFWYTLCCRYEIMYSSFLLFALVTFYITWFLVRSYIQHKNEISFPCSMDKHHITVHVLQWQAILVIIPQNSQWNWCCKYIHFGTDGSELFIFIPDISLSNIGIQPKTNLITSNWKFIYLVPKYFSC